MQEARRRKKGGADAAALLADANSASQHLAVLHIAFMAVCAYVLVIVFGTTDLDLLIGKGIRLPVVNVEVPIVGFYAFAPYLVVLVHLNLLLQLQLLSRKLFAFDAAAPKDEDFGGLHDRLHIFPYTYYLVGRPSPAVQALVGFMVSVTLVLLPLASLLALQIEFLAYQSEAVTWGQRIAIWLDVALIVALWPIILHPRDDWRGYWRELLSVHVPRRRVWLAYLLLLLGLVLLMFGSDQSGAASAGFFALGAAPLIAILLYGWNSVPRVRKLHFALLTMSLFAFLAADVYDWISISPGSWVVGLLLFVPSMLLWHPRAPRGSLVLLYALYFGSIMPLALLIVHEGFERLILSIQAWDHPTTHSETTTFLEILEERRQLDLHEQVLLAKPPKPETLAMIRAGRWSEALTQVEPINLKERHLRNAQMDYAVLTGADLRGSWLQGAVLSRAQLQGANLGGAWLRGADLQRARLQGANLEGAGLQGANLIGAQLQGANLEKASLSDADLAHAQLQGANLEDARLDGADLGFAQLQGAKLVRARLNGALLIRAQLQGANLEDARLDGADLGFAQLQGANLEGAWLRGADLNNATLYGATNGLHASLVDIRGLVWKHLTDADLRKAMSQMQFIGHPDRRSKVLDRLKAASQPGLQRPRLDSCMARAKAPLDCKKRFDPAYPKQKKEFIQELHAYLTELACESPDIARGMIVWQIPGEANPDSTRYRLQVELNKGLEDPKCAGLRGLGAREDALLRSLP